MLHPSNSGKAPTGGPTLTRSFQVSRSSPASTGVDLLGGGPPGGPCCAATATVAASRKMDDVTQRKNLVKKGRRVFLIMAQ
jgi:hypothetical protein